MRPRAALLAISLLLLAGCAETADDPVVPTVLPDETGPTTVDVDFEGDVGIVVCGPDLEGGCAGVALSSPSGVFEVRNPGDLRTVDLTLTWTPATPAGLILAVQMYCEGPDGGCLMSPDRVEGQSPLVFRGDVQIPAGERAVVYVAAVDATHPAGLRSQASDGTTFILSGTLTYG